MTNKPESAAVWVEPHSLVEWEHNPRDNDQAVDRVAALIERFGFGAPIVARETDRTVIAGHTRLKAALKLGLEQVPVRFLDLDPADAAMLAVADNKSNELATWDSELLEEVASEEGWDRNELALLCFDDEAIDTILVPVDDMYDTPKEQGSQLDKGSCIKFGRVILPMTDEEAEQLRRKLEAYKAQVGTLYGAAGRMVRSV